MNIIDILLPFPGAELQTGNWAKEERHIDFRREKERAARCTISYAAVELKTYLEKTLQEADVRFAEKCSEGRFAICLAVEDYASKDDSYQLIPKNGQLLIKGAGRAGVLYGVYEFLKMQGWRWYEPGENRETAPIIRESLLLPDKVQSYATKNQTFRGFFQEGLLKESEELLIWMARNRLNVCGYRKNSASLSNKLCIEGEAGGHIFEDILYADRVLPDGKTMWEAHMDWYGTPRDGEKIKEKVLGRQFCVTNTELTEFLGEEILTYIMNDWYGAERINVWGFDTWGGVCHCENCKKIGNGTDQNVYFLSRIRAYLDQARAEGRLDHDVKLVMCVYEGTCNIKPPTARIPQNMIDAGDYLMFAPIVRCYAHDFSDETCSYNQFYQEHFLNWMEKKGNISFGILEYFNVSKFEDLPLVFINRLKNDVKFYSDHGASGFTYMHLPMTAWAMRTLTQVLYAELMWNPDFDVERFLAEYFVNRYGEHGTEMRKAYELQEDAWKYITSWRNWKDRSLLTQLQRWSGEVPAVPLSVDDHFETPEGFEKCGEESIDKLSEALTIVKNALRSEKHKLITTDEELSLGGAVNPTELSKRQKDPKIQRNLEEDKRLMIYGMDTMRLMYLMGAYYNAMYNGDAVRSDELWGEIERLEDKMESYYMPLTFACPKVELICKDALTRTQLKDCIRQCRKYRVKMLHGNAPQNQ